MAKLSQLELKELKKETELPLKTQIQSVSWTVF
jgi:hypothetical protein